MAWGWRWWADPRDLISQKMKVVKIPILEHHSRDTITQKGTNFPFSRTAHWYILPRLSPMTVSGKFNSAQEACTKYFVVHILKFEILQTTWKNKTFFVFIFCDHVLLPINWTENKKFVDKAQQCFAFTPQANFYAHIWIFYWRWRWWDWIQAIFLNLLYFKTTNKIVIGRNPI